MPISSEQAASETRVEHGEIAELLGVYALGSVDDCERRLVDTHIVECDACRSEVDAHSEVIALLSAARDELGGSVLPPS